MRLLYQAFGIRAHSFFYYICDAFANYRFVSLLVLRYVRNNSFYIFLRINPYGIINSYFI